MEIGNGISHTDSGGLLHTIVQTCDTQSQSRIKILVTLQNKETEILGTLKDENTNLRFTFQDPTILSHKHQYK